MKNFYYRLSPRSKGGADYQVIFYTQIPTKEESYISKKTINLFLWTKALLLNQ